MVDLSFHKVIKYFLSIFFFFLFSSKSYSENFTFQKLVDLNDPWGSSFINNEELIITEKIKKSFDPKRILNPGKMYTGI